MPVFGLFVLVLLPSGNHQASGMFLVCKTKKYELRDSMITLTVSRNFCIPLTITQREGSLASVVTESHGARLTHTVFISAVLGNRRQHLPELPRSVK